MNFTREPIIETIITPKEGCKLVVRNSKGIGQEEYFVDAIEIVSFGQALFYRSLEKPKSFLLPVTDYEVLEVRETRMVLKNMPIERGIKIGGGRENSAKATTPEFAPIDLEKEDASLAEIPNNSEGAVVAEGRFDKKRERRSRTRRRKGREEPAVKEESNGWTEESVTAPVAENMVVDNADSKKEDPALVAAQPAFTSLLPPPPTLISETISRYRGDPQYRSVFYSGEEKEESALPFEVSDEAVEPLDFSQTEDFNPELFPSLKEEAGTSEDPYTPTYYSEVEDHPERE